MFKLQTMKSSFNWTSNKKKRDLGDLQMFLQFIVLVSALVPWTVSLCTNKFVLIFQWLQDNSKWGNGFLFQSTLFDSTNWLEFKYLSKTFLICRTDLYLFMFRLIIKPFMKELLPLLNLIFYGLRWNSLITHNTLRRLVHCPEAHKGYFWWTPISLTRSYPYTYDPHQMDRDFYIFEKGNRSLLE